MEAVLMVLSFVFRRCVIIPTYGVRGTRTMAVATARVSTCRKGSACLFLLTVDRFFAKNSRVLQY